MGELFNTFGSSHFGVAESAFCGGDHRKQVTPGLEKHQKVGP